MGIDGRVLAFTVALVMGVSAPMSASAESPYQRGVRLYGAADFVGALEALTDALDKAGGARARARVRIYIGLIQVQFGASTDATKTFTLALQNDPAVKLPSRAPERVKKLVENLRAELVKKPSRAQRRSARKSRRRSDRNRRRTSKTKGAPAASPVRSNRPSKARAVNPPASVSSAPPKVAAAAAPALSPSPLPPVEAAAPVQGASVDSSVRFEAVEQPPRVPLTTWIGTGVAAAAVATGGTFAVIASNTNGRARNSAVAEDAFTLHGRALDQQTVSFVAFGIGAAAIVTAVTVWLTVD